MNSTDRLIILIAALAVVLLLGAAAAMMPSINRSRQQLQLVVNDQTMKNLPPDIAVTQAALGAFRGLAVDIVWGRAIRMQQDGQFYEAMQLADWITKLQPRFVEVWRFHAWNMAYNISVLTHTPRERWMWVRSGIELLRDEAIPLNPNAVTLYRELSYIYLHKVGQYMDEMHWFYKREHARQWHELLGPPPEGSAEQVAAWFRPIAEMYDRYLNSRLPNRRIQRKLEELRGDAALRDRLEPLRHLTLSRFDIELAALREELRRDAPELADKLRPLRDLVNRQFEAARRDPMQRLLEDRPDIAPLLESLAQMNLKPDLRLLRRISEAQAVSQSQHVRMLGLSEPQAQKEALGPLRQWLEDESTAEARRDLLAFVRARVLSETYHMDPLWMLELMEGEWFIEPEDLAEMKEAGESFLLPIDWRHPMAHALYWASTGVRRSHGVRNLDSIDSLNTDRMVLAALQGLTHNGNLVFDPLSNYYRQSVDTRFIDVYHYAVFGLRSRIVDKEYNEYIQSSVAPESYQSGHENFLIWAITTFYFYGQTDKAQEYYDLLRTLYFDNFPGRNERYAKPLQDFVYSEFVQTDRIATLDDAREAVNGLLFQAIQEGLAMGRRDIANRMLNFARQTHQRYNSRKEPSRYQHVGVESRMQLPRFDDMLASALGRFMLYPPGGFVSPVMKSRVWANAPVELKRRIYDAIRPTLHQQAQAMGIDPQAAFPEPPGMEAYRRQQGGQAQGDAEQTLITRPERN